MRQLLPLVCVDRAALEMEEAEAEAMARAEQFGVVVDTTAGMCRSGLVGPIGADIKHCCCYRPVPVTRTHNPLL